ncbi:MAG: hypothetical protein NTY64_13065 [Deltaproteobacteria bacterium]|nr:hypothetical protein [Deltaproteobacteria bacterium]
MAWKVGHDPGKCPRYLEVTIQDAQAHFDFKGWGCGFCQAILPCEFGIPVQDECGRERICQKGHGGKGRGASGEIQ